MLKKFSDFVHSCEDLLSRSAVIIIFTLFKLIWVILWMPLSVKYAFDKTYFPECKRKNFLVRLGKNIVWTLKNQRANRFYNLYGLDINGRRTKDYIDENEFWRGLRKLNNTPKYSGGGVQPDLFA